MDRLVRAEQLFLGHAELSDAVRLGLADVLLTWSRGTASGGDKLPARAVCRRALIRLQLRDPRLYPILADILESGQQAATFHQGPTDQGLADGKPVGQGAADGGPTDRGPIWSFAQVAEAFLDSLPMLLRSLSPLEAGQTPWHQSRGGGEGVGKRPSGAAHRGSIRPCPTDGALRMTLWAQAFAVCWAREKSPESIPLIPAACIALPLAWGALPAPACSFGQQSAPPKRGETRAASPHMQGAAGSLAWQARIRQWGGDGVGRSALAAAAIGWESASLLWETALAAGLQGIAGRATRRSRKAPLVPIAPDAVLAWAREQASSTEGVRPAAEELIAALRSAGPHAIQSGFLRAERHYRRLRRRFAQATSVLAQAASNAARLYALTTEFAATAEQAKLDAMAEFAAGAGHEINNPLAIIGGYAQVLLQGSNDPEQRCILAAILAQVRRAHEMIADARLFSRPPRPTLRTIDLREVVDQIEPSLRELAARYGTAIQRETPPQPVVIQADPAQLAVAFSALVKNAIEAAAGGGRVVLILHAGQDQVALEVRDNGPGISPEHRQHIFDPYYSARQAGRGLGLGLSKAWRIARLHGGRIEVQSRSGQETVFTLRLPRTVASRDQGQGAM